jgi:hypothetical protein
MRIRRLRAVGRALALVGACVAVGGRRLRDGPPPCSRHRPHDPLALLRPEAEGRRTGTPRREGGRGAVRDSAPSPGQRDAIYDRLLATLGDSHTFRMAPAATPRGRVGIRRSPHRQDGDGYAVKGVVPGGAGVRRGAASRRPRPRRRRARVRIGRRSRSATLLRARGPAALDGLDHGARPLGAAHDRRRRRPEPPATSWSGGARASSRAARRSTATRGCGA